MQSWLGPMLRDELQKAFKRAVKEAKTIGVNPSLHAANCVKSFIKYEGEISTTSDASGNTYHDMKIFHVRVVQRVDVQGNPYPFSETLPILVRITERDNINTLSPILGTHEETKQPNLVLPSLRRAFSLYDQINLIDNVPEDQLRFQEFDETSFTVNSVKYEGSLLCVGNLLMSWSPRNFSEITTDSLSIFQTVRPIPELLIVGCGRYNQPLNPQVRQFVKSIGMKLETVDSRNAASTYNILNEEGRIVAAALLPYGVTS